MVRKFSLVVGLAVVTLAGGCSLTRTCTDRALDHYAKASVLMDDYQVAQALAELDQALALDGTLVLAYSAKGDILRLEGRYEEAAVAYESAVALDPKWKPTSECPGPDLYCWRNSSNSLADR